MIETLRPSAPGDECNIRNENGATCPNHYQNVDEVTRDAWSTAVVEWNVPYVTWYRDLYNVADHSVGGGIVNKITLKGWFTSEDPAPSEQTNVKFVIKSGEGDGAPDTVSEGAEQTSYYNGIWLWLTQDWTLNPKTGQRFTWDEIDKLQIGISLRCPKLEGGACTACTQLYVEVDYTPLPSKKRVSAASIKPIIKTYIPDGSIDVQDRLFAAWLYAGIAIKPPDEGVTEFGRLTFEGLDEFGRLVYGGLDEYGRLVQGAVVAITPVPASAIATAISPTIVGNIFITPTPAMAKTTSINPTVAIGGVSITPTFAPAVIQAINPSVIKGSLTLTPTVASAVASAVNPTVVLGSTSKTPTPASAIATAINPIVITPDLLVVPTPASATAVALSPLNLITTPAGAKCEAINPTVLLGSSIATPTPAPSVALAVNPSVIAGGAIVIPDFAPVVAGAVNPELVMSSIVIVPTHLDFIGGAVNPTITVTEVGRILKVMVITSLCRDVKVKTCQYRHLKLRTSHYRKVKVLTSGG